MRKLSMEELKALHVKHGLEVPEQELKDCKDLCDSMAKKDSQSRCAAVITMARTTAPAHLRPSGAQMELLFDAIDEMTVAVIEKAEQ